jgi:hypothetical protein
VSYAESSLAALLTGGLSFLVDQGIFFHVCLYSSIAAGGKFSAEEAFKAMRKSYFLAARLVAATSLVCLSYLFTLSQEISEIWEIVSISFLSAVFISLSMASAIKSFRQTEYYSASGHE